MKIKFEVEVEVIEVKPGRGGCSHSDRITSVAAAGHTAPLLDAHRGHRVCSRARDRVGRQGVKVLSEVDADRLRFLGHVLEGYFAWRRDTDRLGFAPFARVVGIPEAIEHRRVLDLSDDQFTRVDQSFARCQDDPLQLQSNAPFMICGWIMAIEYEDPRPRLHKARDAGYSGPNYGAIVGRYNKHLRQAQSIVYVDLAPEIETWLEEML
jgi:hypothetical protein